jgi:alpha-glucosidase
MTELCKRPLVLLLIGTMSTGVEARLASPDGNVSIDFLMLDNGVPVYKVSYLGQPIVLASRLGFEPDFMEGFKLVGTSTSAHEGQWTNDFGERKTVPDDYCELDVDLKHSSGRLLRLTFRAYNEGAALRYSWPDQSTKEFTFTAERTEFWFPEGTYGYEAHGTEGEYRRVATGEIRPYCERPLTLEYASGIHASLAEAANTAYPRMLLSPQPDVPGALVTALGGRTSNRGGSNQRYDPTVRLAAGDATPWRMFVVGQKPGDLLERDYLMLNLNPPSALADTAWIKPGKVMRDTTLTTENSKAIIDFAATAGLQYTHLDTSWYGSEDAQTGDATQARAPNLDIHEIVRYGREKNVGLIVYVDRRQMKRQRDTLFPLFEQWGIKGVKIGFIDVGPQEETVWTTQTIQQAAEHHLMLNIHDGYRATGNNRTYPNLMTVEGIRGNEHMPTPEHNCTLPFTRYVAGIGDYTVCYFDRRLKTTHAHQLAMAVVSFSPLQWIFWYDRPSMYQGEPEVEFFREVPTVWDETKVINGEIGKFATIARRSGDEWFIGTINNSEPRTLRIPLDFLTEGKNYIAHIYFDDDTVDTRTKVGIDVRPVDAKMAFDVPLRPGGGQAVWIAPALRRRSWQDRQDDLAAMENNHETKTQIRDVCHRSDASSGVGSSLSELRSGLTVCRR